MANFHTSQLWAYDDIVNFQATQATETTLSTQFGRAPASAFCPSCGAFTLNVADTQAGREAHIRDCKDSGESDISKAHSDGEDCNTIVPESSSRTAQSSEQTSGNLQPKRKIPSEACSDEHSRVVEQGAVNSPPGVLADCVSASLAEVQQQTDQGGTDGHTMQQWLHANGLADQSEAFLKANVIPDLLPFLEDEDLKQMGISCLGPRRRVLAAIQNICSSHTGRIRTSSSAKVTNKDHLTFNEELPIVLVMPGKHIC